MRMIIFAIICKTIFTFAFLVAMQVNVNDEEWVQTHSVHLSVDLHSENVNM